MQRNTYKKPHLILSFTTLDSTIFFREQLIFLNKYFQITIITSPSENQINFNLPSDIKFKFFPLARKISPIRDIICIVKLFLFIRKNSPEIVHSFTPKAGLLVMISTFLAFVPIRVHTFTGLIFPTSRGFKRILFMIVDSIICFFSNKILAESIGVKRDLYFNGITSKQVSILGNGNICGVNTSYFLPDNNFNFSDPSIHPTLKKIFFSSKKNFLFTYVGRLSNDKGIDNLLKSFIYINDLFSDSKLLIVGPLDSRDPISSKSFELINSHKSISYISFLKDLRPVYSISKILILPSIREGFPNVLLEAFSSGIPVISTKVSGATDLVDDEINGWLIDIDNLHELKEKMLISYKRSNDSLKGMGDNGRKKVEELYDRNKFHHIIHDFYQSLLNKK